MPAGTVIRIVGDSYDPAIELLIKPLNTALARFGLTIIDVSKKLAPQEPDYVYWFGMITLKPSIETMGEMLKAEDEK